MTLSGISVGIPGFAAWIGITVIGDPKPGENVFISAAAGGVGLVAGQLAKLKGCRVVGSVGSDAKVSETIEVALISFTPNIACTLEVARISFFSSWIDMYMISCAGEVPERGDRLRRGIQLQC